MAARDYRGYSRVPAGYGRDYERRRGGAAVRQRGSAEPLPEEAGRGPVPKPRRSKTDAARSRRRRFFLVLVVIPLLLMVGSIYLSSVAGNMQERAAALEEEVQSLGSENQALEIRSSELSRPERIMESARGLGLQEPGAENVEVYEGE